MLLPALLPAQFELYAAAENDAQLLEMLSQKPADLIIFFEYACEHETWSEAHADFMRRAIAWMTDRALKERLSSESIRHVINSIYMHYQMLKPFIIHNITFIVEEHAFPANTLLWSAQSEYFRQLIQAECNVKHQTRIELKGITFEKFALIDAFIQLGKVGELWRYSQSEILLLLRQVTNYRLAGLMEECEHTLKRYLNRDNVFDTLKMAHEESWTHLENHCCEYINQLSLDIILSRTEDLSHQEERPLAIEFKAFNASALDAFDKIKGLITHLICSGFLLESPDFTRVVNDCPRLLAVDVNHSQVFSERLLELPVRVQELDLSNCSWLTNHHLQWIVQAYPKLPRIKLSGNIQINFSGWGSLQQLRALGHLDISRCTQISDEDLRLILKAGRNVTELNLAECSRISEAMFYELVKGMPHLTALNIARCNVTDGVILEIAARCRNLRVLNIERCRNVSEKAIVQTVREVQQLQEINLKYCTISEAGIAKIKAIRPLIHILS